MLIPQAIKCSKQRTIQTEYSVTSTVIKVIMNAELDSYAPKCFCMCVLEVVFVEMPKGVFGFDRDGPWIASNIGQTKRH